MTRSTPRFPWLQSTPVRLALGVAMAAVMIAIGSWVFRGAVADAPGAAEGPAVDAPGIDAPVVDVPAVARPAAEPGEAGGDGLLPPDDRVAFWEGRVGNGGGYLDQIYLSDAYVDRARAIGDLSDLRRAEAALAVAAKTAPDPNLVLVREALIAFTLHEFSDALATATGVLETDAENLTAMSVAGDSQLELGAVDAAEARYQRLAELSPSPAAWSRLGRVAFLRGDLRGAVALVTDAAEGSVSSGFPDEIAFYHVQLGDLHRASGRLGDAEVAYAAALGAMPGHVLATAGLARVREAQGRRDEAIALLEPAVRRLPLPDQVSALGDLYALSGDEEAAEEQYALVEAIAGINAEESVYDRAYVLFAADHERDVSAAVARAEAELELRVDVYGYDALAWALYAAGRFEEADAAAGAALALGTADPRIAYHAGMIAAALGREGEARELLSRALDGSALLPPLQVPRAEATLAGLDAQTSP